MNLLGQSLLSARRSESGFTLIEVMLTGAILGVLAIVAIPAFGDFMRKLSTNRFTNSILQAMRNARIQSIAEQKEIRGVFDLDKGSLNWEICSAPGDCDNNGGTWEKFTKIQPIHEPDDVNLYGVGNQLAGSKSFYTSGIHYIEFLPAGTKQFAAVVITWRPTPATSEPCKFNSIYNGSTGESIEVVYKGVGYGSYYGDFSSYELTNDGTGAPGCATS